MAEDKDKTMTPAPASTETQQAALYQLPPDLIAQLYNTAQTILNETIAAHSSPSSSGDVATNSSQSASTVQASAAVGQYNVASAPGNGNNGAQMFNAAPGWGIAHQQNSSFGATYGQNTSGSQLDRTQSYSDQQPYHNQYQGTFGQNNYYNYQAQEGNPGQTGFGYGQNQRGRGRGMYSQGWGRGGRAQNTGWSQGTSHEWSNNRGRGNLQQQRGRGSRGSAYQRAGWTTSAGTRGRTDSAGTRGRTDSAGTRGRTDRGRGTWNTWSSRPYRGAYQGSTTKNSSEITVGYNFEGKLVGPERSAKSFGEFKVCNICNVKTNSSVTAESHYSGKQHLRKLKELEQKKELESKYDLHGEDMHCKLCNVSFTCVDQIEKHYGGARHKRNLDGGDAKKGDSEAAPDTGEEGDEPPTKKQKGQEQSAGGGAGDDAASQKESEGSAEAAPHPPPKLYVCDICNIKTTSQGLLDGHIEGKKHQRRLKQLNLPQPIKFLPQAQADSTTMADSTQFQCSPAELEAAKIVKFGPTGREKTFYKCDVCNIEDINSPTQYKQHMKSKKHQMVLVKKLTEAGVIQPQDLPSNAESNEPSYDPSFEPFIQAAKFIKPGRTGRERAFYKCDVCCIEDINSPTQFVQHLCNSKHQAALSKKEESNAVKEPQA